MLLQCVGFKAMWHRVKVVIAYSTDEAFGLHVLLNLFLLVSEFSKSVDDQTLYDGQEDDNHEEEKGDVKDDAVDLVLISRRVFDFIANAPSNTNAPSTVIDVSSAPYS